MTLTQLRAEIRRCTNTSATNAGGWDNDVLDLKINEAVLEIAHITSAYVGSTVDSGSFATVASTRLYTYPTSALKLYQLFYNGDRLPFKELDELPSGTTSSFWGTYSRPEYWYMERNSSGSRIGFYPVPSEAKTVTTWYAVKPATLGADSDVPNLPDFLHPAIAWYVSREYWLSNQKADMASYYGDRYIDRITLWRAHGHEDGTRQELLEPDEGV